MDNNLVAGFKYVWSQIHNPRSACPDVEIGHVLDVMAEALAKQEFGPPDLDDIQRFVLAQVTITEEEHLASLGMTYSMRHVKRYIDGETNEYGYPKHRPHEEVYAEEEALADKVRQAALALVKRGLLVQREERLYLPG